MDEAGSKVRQTLYEEAEQGPTHCLCETPRMLGQTPKFQKSAFVLLGRKQESLSLKAVYWRVFTQQANS
eukprot:378712-Amphidinium_carterae.1